MTDEARPESLADLLPEPLRSQLYWQSKGYWEAMRVCAQMVSLAMAQGGSLDTVLRELKDGLRRAPKDDATRTPEGT
jgi:hypothetical protein